MIVVGREAVPLCALAVALLVALLNLRAIVSPENSVHPRRNHTGKQIEDSISCGLPELVNENPKFTDLRT